MITERLMAIFALIPLLTRDTCRMLNPFDRRIDRSHRSKSISDTGCYVGRENSDREILESARNPIF